MSARRPVSRARQVVETQELKARDPRFDVLSGSVNKDLFRKSYSFLAEQHQQELETMRKTAAAARKNRQLPQEEKDRIDEALRRMENREVTRKNKDLQEEAMRQWKKEEADKRKEGKKAFFLKECMFPFPGDPKQPAVADEADRFLQQPRRRSSSSRPSTTTSRRTSANCTRRWTRSDERRRRRRRSSCAYECCGRRRGREEHIVLTTSRVSPLRPKSRPGPY